MFLYKCQRRKKIVSVDYNGKVENEYILGKIN